MEGARCGLGRAAFSGHAQGPGPEDGIIASAFGRPRAVFQGVRKLRPYAVQVYPTTSLAFPGTIYLD